MTRKGFSLGFKGPTCTVQSPSSKVIGRIPEIRGLYRVIDYPKPTTVSTIHQSANTASKTMTISELHRKMGHINHDNLGMMVKDGLVEGIDLNLNSKPEFCKICIKAKAVRKSFPKKSTNADVKAYGDKVCSDLWGPAQVQSLGHKNYFQLLQDQHS